MIDENFAKVILAAAKAELIKIILLFNLIISVLTYIPLSVLMKKLRNVSYQSEELDVIK